MAGNLPAVIDKNSLIQSIMTKMTIDESAYLIAVLKNDIRVLGPDELFALRDGSGEIRAFKQSLPLSSHNGGLVQPVSGGPYVISAQGYEMWAEAAGAQVVFPPEVLVESKMMPNPAVIRDPSNGRILYVAARAIAWRFTSKGAPQVSDWTTYYDNPSYRMIDLLSKAKKTKAAFRLMPAGDKPEVTQNEKWASYPFDESMTLWVDTSHDEVIGWLSSIINREKKSIDFAQSFAKRNALKHLSGLQKVPGQEQSEVKTFKDKKTGEDVTYSKNKVTPISEWLIPVISWRSTGKNVINWSQAEYANLRARSARLIENLSEFAEGEEVIDIKHAQVTTGREDVGDEMDVTGESIDPEDVIDIGPDPDPIAEHFRNEAIKIPDLPPQENPAKTPRSTKAPDVTNPAPPPSNGMSEDQKKIMGNLKVSREEFPVEFKKACMFLRIGFGDDVEYTVGQAQAILKKVNELADQF